MNESEALKLNIAVARAVAEAAKDLEGTIHDLIVEALQDAELATKAEKA